MTATTNKADAKAETEALPDDVIDACIREWMSSDDGSADGFRERMRRAIAAYLSQPEQPALGAEPACWINEDLLYEMEGYDGPASRA